MRIAQRHLGTCSDSRLSIPVGSLQSPKLHFYARLQYGRGRGRLRRQGKLVSGTVRVCLMAFAKGAGELPLSLKLAWQAEL